MKTLILVSLAALMFAIPAVVFYTSAGRITTNNITLKTDRGSLTVRPAVVVIRPQ